MPVPPEDRIVGPGFRQKVYDWVARVPEGSVSTYGDIATLLGSPRVARQVGYALSALPEKHAASVPWHRIINGQGRISFRGDLSRAELQQRKLEAEGVAFDAQGRVVAFAERRWRLFSET